MVDKSTKIINYKFKQRLCTETVWEDDCPLTCGPHGHMSSASAKPPFKTAKRLNVNGFDSSMVKNTRFWSLMAKIELR